MKCYYHNDADGRCAGAIVAKFFDYKEHQDHQEYIGVDYKDGIDVGEIRKGEKIVIVDFSFHPDVMKKVFEITDDVIWIDHHKTAIEKYSDDMSRIEGLRAINFSGCELAWFYFYPDVPVPLAVSLIGDRDKWAWKYGDTAPFNQGLKLYDYSPTSSIWKDLLNNVSELNESIIEKGKICLEFRDNFCKDYADRYGFETEFEGYKSFALGLYMFGSEAFGGRFDEYPLCLSFVYHGDKWTVSLYSKTIDVDEIAKKYGGGGHVRAAGFICDELPFRKI